MAGSFQTRFETAPEEGVKAPCVASTPSNITLSGEQTIDSVAVVAGDRVLVRSQTDATENGIYDAAVGLWSRSTDFNAVDDVINGILVVDANPTNKGVFQAEFTGDYEPGTTSITFTETLFNTLTSKIGSTGIQGEYDDKGQYHINYMDDLIGVDLTGFPVGETVLCNALNVSSPGTYSVWEKVADAQTPPDPATGLNTTDNRWYSALTNATEFKQVRQLSCLTIADLKLIEGTPNQIIEVISYDSPDFGLPNPYKGNGKFVRDSTSTETDNSAGDRTVIQTTGIATGRWIRVYDALVDAAGNFTGTDIETALSECATKTTAQTLTNKTLTSPVLNTGVSGTAIDTTVTTSTTKFPHSNAVKTYVDTYKIVTGTLTFSNVLSNANVETTITHGLGTDNVDFGLKAIGSGGTDAEKSAVRCAIFDINRKFVAFREYTSAITTGTEAEPTTPATGDLAVTAINLGPSTQSITIDWWVRIR